MLTPEDELDVLDQELGRLRRRLHECQRSLFDGRMTDQAERAVNERYLKTEIARLELKRAELIADAFADSEARDG